MHEAEVIIATPEDLALPDGCPSCGSEMVKRVRKDERMPSGTLVQTTEQVDYACNARLRRSTEGGLQTPDTKVLAGCPEAVRRNLDG